MSGLNARAALTRLEAIDCHELRESLLVYSANNPAAVRPTRHKAARRWTGVDSAFSFLFEGVIDIATEKENTLSTVSKRELGSLHFCLPCCQLRLWLHAPAKYPFGAASRFRCNGIDPQEEFTGESVNLVGTVNFDMSM